jgi:hypothetical protein
LGLLKMRDSMLRKTERRSRARSVGTRDVLIAVRSRASVGVARFVHVAELAVRRVSRVGRQLGYGHEELTTLAPRSRSVATSTQSTTSPSRSMKAPAPMLLLFTSGLMLATGSK